MATLKKKADQECCADCDCGHERAFAEIKKAGDKLAQMAKKAYQKYDKADPKTKQTIVAGILGAAALIAGAVAVKTKKKK
jgi:hypothetical protein